MVLLLAKGISYKGIQKLLDTTVPTISRWRARFVRQRIAGLMEERHPGPKALRENASSAGTCISSPRGRSEGWIHTLVVPLLTSESTRTRFSESCRKPMSRLQTDCLYLYVHVLSR
jgi:hypothetical protein